MTTRLLDKFLLILAGLFVPFVFAEIACRIYDHELLCFRNFLEERVSQLKAGYPAEFDPMLGWVPASHGTEHNLWNTTVTITPEGIRSNGSAVSNVPPTILAVGDSFTFGDQVSDRDTWPAQLETLLGKRVVNGGVFGYGLDQSVLRTKLLLKAYPTIKTVLVSFIPDDLERCELSQRWYAHKPYFIVERGNLHLRNVPVPQPRLVNEFGLLRAVFGYSALVNHLMVRSAPQFWLGGRAAIGKRVSHDRRNIGCLLLKGLKDLERLNGARIVTVVQGERDLPKQYRKDISFLERCARDVSLDFLDLTPKLHEVRTLNKQEFQTFFFEAGGHMTPQGNQFIAQQIVDYLNH